MNCKIKCRICLNEGNHKIYFFREKYFGTNESYEYFECSKCGCIQIKDNLPDIGKHYSKEYYSFNEDPEKREENYSITDRILSKLYIIRDKYVLLKKGKLGFVLEMIKENDEKKFCSLKILRLNDKLKILDIGCGDGSLLYYLRSLGFKDLTGIDPYLNVNITYKNKLKILKSDIMDLIIEKLCYDVVMLHHVFEHVTNPGETLLNISKILLDDGIIILRIPIKDSYAWNNYKEDWVQIDAPRHNFIYSLKSIEYLCENNGFEINKIVYDSSEFQFWGSEQYRRNISLISDRSYNVNSNKSIFSRDDIKQYKNTAKKLNMINQGDQIVLYLTKKKLCNKEWIYQ